jgi:hypothetical protein
MVFNPTFYPTLMVFNPTFYPTLMVFNPTFYPTLMVFNPTFNFSWGNSPHRIFFGKWKRGKIRFDPCKFFCNID